MMLPPQIKSSWEKLVSPLWLRTVLFRISCRFYSSLNPELISFLKSFLFKHEFLSLINLQSGDSLSQI